MKITDIREHTDDGKLKADNELFAFNRERYGDRIRMYRQQKGITQPQLAQMLGLTKNTVSNWEAGRGRPDINLIPQLCELLDITVSQFFGAAGSARELNIEQQRMLRDMSRLSPANRMVLRATLSAMLQAQESEQRSARILDMKRILRSDLRASAGTGNYLFDSTDTEYSYLHLPANLRKADELITVYGNSMEPTFHDGDQLLVAHTQSISYGEIGVFIVDGEGFVKEYQRDGLHSHNPKYATRHFEDGQDVRIVGRVLGVVSEDMIATDDEIEAFEQKH